MVHALGTPKRHPESGIYLFRKRVPERLRQAVGRREIKFSLRTRDPVVARIRNLEEAARLERAWSGIDAEFAGGRAQALARFERETASGIMAVSVVEPAAIGADTPPAGSAAVVAPPKTPIPLRPIFQAYAKEAQLAPSTVKRWSPVVDRLTEHLGHDDAAAITRADIVAWKDALLESEMSNARSETSISPPSRRCCNSRSIRDNLPKTRRRR